MVALQSCRDEHRTTQKSKLIWIRVTTTKLRVKVKFRRPQSSIEIPHHLFSKYIRDYLGVVHVYNPTTREAEAAGLLFQGQPRVHSKFQGISGYRVSLPSQKLS